MKHITQIENGCVIACIAMVGNLTQKEVLAAFPEFDGVGICQEDTIIILRRLQIPYIQYVSTSLYENRLFIVTVPSLNTPMGNHCVVVKTDKEGKPTIYDPAKGLKDKLFYESIRCWSEVLEIPQIQE